MRYAGISSVAPYVGAWIETKMFRRSSICERVAPYVGAWIETEPLAKSCHRLGVAPYVGAWIETKLLNYLGYGNFRRTLRGCVD